MDTHNSKGTKEEEQREKNRIAARKCRMNKEKKSEELKLRNKELEQENKLLSDQKKQLKKKAREYKEMIKNHQDKGCKIPNELLEEWDVAEQSDSEDEDFLDADGSQGVGVQENNSTTLSISNSRFSILQGGVQDSLAVSAAYVSKDMTEQPQSLGYQGSNEVTEMFSSNDAIALFSGKPLNSNVKSMNTSNNSSVSSSPLITLTMPKALAPVATVPRKQHHKKEIMAHELSHRVFETNGQLQQSAGYISQMAGATNAINCSESVIYQFTMTEQQLLENLNNTNVTMPSEHENTQNLMQLEPSLAEEYSYTEDLHQMDSANECMTVTDTTDQHTIPPLGIQNNTNLNTSQSEPSVPMQTIARTLLELAPQMSPLLQEQIKSSFKASSKIDINPVLTGKQNSQSLNKENYMHQGHFEVVSGKKNCTEVIPEAVTNKSLPMVSDIHGKKLFPAVVLSPAQARQNFNLRQFFNYQRQVSDQIPQNGSDLGVIQEQHVQNLILRKQTEQLVSPQPKQLFKKSEQHSPLLTSESTTNGLVPNVAYSHRMVPAIALASDNSSPNPVNDHSQSVSYLSSGTIDLPSELLLSQYWDDGSLTTLSQNHSSAISYATSTSTAQTFASGQNTNNSEINDSSHHVQDIPIMDLANLNSDSNMFENGPSDSTS